MGCHLSAKTQKQKQPQSNSNTNKRSEKKAQTEIQNAGKVCNNNQKNNIAVTTQKNFSTSQSGEIQIQMMKEGLPPISQMDIEQRSQTKIPQESQKFFDHNIQKFVIIPKLCSFEESSLMKKRDNKERENVINSTKILKHDKYFTKDD